MKTIHRSILPALALGFLLAAAAAGQHHVMGGKVEYDPEPGGGDPNTPAGCAGVQAKVTINNNNSTFSPATITVNPGEPVCWTWSRTAGHNVRGDDGSFTSGPPVESGTFQRTFNTPGTHGYHCQVHGSPTSGMRGTVVVRGNSGGGGGEDGPGKLELAPTTYTVSEGAGALTVTVERVGGSRGAATVKFTTANGTARIGKDFLRRAGILRWANGDQEPKTFQVPIKNDRTAERDESFVVRLTKATGAPMGAKSATVTIQDDDAGRRRSALAAPSQLQARGSAGEIHLTWVDESGEAKSLRIERRPPGGTFREIATVAAGVDSFTDTGLPGGAVLQYRIRAEAADGSSAVSGIAAGATDSPATPCDEARNALCLNNGRFEAKVEWHRSAVQTGREITRLTLPEAPNSGAFSFSSEDGPQILLKVHDGCAINERYWLSFAALTDLEFTLQVRDTQTGRNWVYFNEAGSLPAPVRDVEAFATCP